MPAPENLESPASARRESRRAGILYAAATALLAASAAVVRFKSLDAKPFWFDECYSAELARIDWRNFAHLLWWREANMSLYYVLLRAWTHFGQSPFFIRSLSAAIAVATVPAMYWLALELYDRRVGLIAASLLTFNAYHLRYSQEARSYALFVLLAVLSSGFLVMWLKQPSRRLLLAYETASVLAVYAHFYALFLVLAQWMMLRWGRPPKDLPKDSEAMRCLRRAWITIAIASAPLLIFVAKTGAGPIKWIQRPGLSDLFRFAEQLSGGTLWTLLAVSLACILALIPSGRKLWIPQQQWPTWRIQFLLTWLMFPIALTVVLSLARPVFLPRYMIFCLPPLLILAAAGVASVRTRWLSSTTWICFLVLSWQATNFVYAHDYDAERDASGAAASFILDHATSGDAIVFHIANTRVPYEFFRSVRAGTDTASPLYAGNLGPEILFPHHGPGLDYRDFTGKPAKDFLRSTLPRYRRVWVMLMNNGAPGAPDPTTGLISGVATEVFAHQAHWQFWKVEVRLYSSDPIADASRP